MPRRDAISEEKRRRLMQEHEQLQKLMFHARSSVRRSSMKEPEHDETPSTEEANPTQYTYFENRPAVPDNVKEEISDEDEVTKEEPLTEKDMFSWNATVQDANVDKPLLTETDLFQETNNTVAPREAQPKSTINVIRPHEHAAATVVPFKTKQTEEKPYEHTISEERPIPEESIRTEAEPVYDDYPIEENRKSSKARTYVLLLIAALLAGFGGYYFYMTNQAKTTTVAKRSTAPVSKPAPSTSVITPMDSAQGQKTNDSRTEDAQPVDTKRNTPEKKAAIPAVQPPTEQSGKESNNKASATSKPISDELKKFDNVTVVTTPSDGLGKYKVISKAYFYNEPDESTRRKAFIVHWNNAVLTPTEEKNGFVYVVFTNHLGQTSKGWLRKSDLQRIE